MKKREPSLFVSVLERHPQHVLSLGMISIEIANLEIFLGQLLGAVLHIDQYIAEAVYLTPRAAIARIEVLRNAVDFSLTEGSRNRKQIEKLLNKSASLIQERHNLVHVIWVMDKNNLEEVRKMRVPIRKSGGQSEVVPLKKLTDFVKEIRNLCEAVRTLTDELYDSWPPYTSQPISSAQPAALSGTPKRPRKVRTPKRKGPQPSS